MRSTRAPRQRRRQTGNVLPSRPAQPVSTKYRLRFGTLRLACTQQTGCAALSRHVSHTSTRRSQKPPLQTAYALRLRVCADQDPSNLQDQPPRRIVFARLVLLGLLPQPPILRASHSARHALRARYSLIRDRLAVPFVLRGPIRDRTPLFASTVLLASTNHQRARPHALLAALALMQTVLVPQAAQRVPSGPSLPQAQRRAPRAHQVSLQVWLASRHALSRKHALQDSSRLHRRQRFRIVSV